MFTFLYKRAKIKTNVKLKSVLKFYYFNRKTTKLIGAKQTNEIHTDTNIEIHQAEVEHKQQMCYLSHSLIYHWMMAWISTHINWCFCRMSVYVVVLQLKYITNKHEYMCCWKKTKERRIETRWDVRRRKFFVIWKFLVIHLTLFERERENRANTCGWTDAMLCYYVLCVTYLQSHFHRLYLVCPLVCHLFSLKMEFFRFGLCTLHSLRFFALETNLKQLSLKQMQVPIKWGFYLFSILFSFHIRFERKKLPFSFSSSCLWIKNDLFYIFVSSFIKFRCVKLKWNQNEGKLNCFLIN